MNIAITTPWSPADFCTTATTAATGQHLSALAAAVYDRVCRTNFNSPGFRLIDLGTEGSSPALRRFMVALKKHMQEIHQDRTGHGLVFGNDSPTNLASPVSKR